MCVCVFEVIGSPSLYSMIRKVAVLVRVTFAFRVVKNATRWHNPLVDCGS